PLCVARPTPAVRQGRPRTETWSGGFEPAHQSLSPPSPGLASLRCTIIAALRCGLVGLPADSSRPRWYEPSLSNHLQGTGQYQLSRRRLLSVDSMAMVMQSSGSCTCRLAAATSWGAKGATPWLCAHRWPSCAEAAREDGANANTMLAARLLWR